jgi:ketosteroid isomerase-like protein
MQRSPEVAALVQAFSDAMKRGDAAAVVTLIAQDDATLFIGTDPDEWWEGPTQVRASMAAQLAAMGDGIELTGGEPRAYASGDMAWFAYRPSLRLADATKGADTYRCRDP